VENFKKILSENYLISTTDCSSIQLLSISVKEKRARKSLSVFQFNQITSFQVQIRVISIQLLNMWVTEN
jgi:hypothetical protein